MPKEQTFSHQDKQLLQEVSQAVKWIDVVNRNGEAGINELIRQIVEICEDTARKTFAAIDEDKEYVAVLEITHDTEPAEVRFYIHEKLKIKLGQIVRAVKERIMSERKKTEILILTKEGYRQTTPKELDKYRKGKNHHDKHIADFSLGSASIIFKLLSEFRKSMS